MPICAASWPCPEMMKAILPARCMSHIRSSTARARSIWRYIASTSASVRPSALCPSSATLVFAISSILSDVDRCAIDGQRRLDEHFGEGRMGVDRHRDLAGRPLQQQGQCGRGEELARVRADQLCATQEAVLRIGDELGEAVHLADDGGLAERPE